jgi:hypothetical protein
VTSTGIVLQTAKKSTDLVTNVPSRDNQKKVTLNLKVDEESFLKKYPIDRQFIDQLEWIGQGLILTSENSQSTDGLKSPVAPIIRLQHQSVAAVNLQRKLAQVLCSRLNGVFTEITAKQLRSVKRESFIVGDTAEIDLTSETLSAIMKLQKQELENGLYTFNTASTGKRQKHQRHTDPLAALTTKDLPFLISPALIELLEPLVHGMEDDALLVVYLPDFEELAPTAKDRRSFADFADRFNTDYGRALFVVPTFGVEDDSGISGIGSLSAKANSDPTMAAMNHDFKLATQQPLSQNPAPINSSLIDCKYGPLWTPLPTNISITDRSVSLIITKPSDPRCALTLRSQLALDEADLIHKHNIRFLMKSLNELSIQYELGEHGDPRIEALTRRARSRHDLHCIAVQAAGLAHPHGLVTTAHIERVLSNHQNNTVHMNQSAPSDDYLSARFSHLLSIDQLNNYERQLLRSSATTPGTPFSTIDISM